jgi:hypothetical protein
MKMRMGYLKLHEEVTLDKVGLTVWAYSKRGKYVGRVEINRAGLAAFTGRRGSNDSRRNSSCTPHRAAHH